ncbi:MAG: transposase [Dehalococcoidia bacterium]
MPRRKSSPRLENFDHLGPIAAHLIFVTRQRVSLFTDPAAARICRSALLEAAEKLNANIHAYCLMPDHVHVLAEVGGGASITEFARRFKLLSGYRLKQHTGEFAWQVSFGDHVLRREEALLDVARYIWENPVKEGLAADWRDYPHSGPRELMG